MATKKQLLDRNERKQWERLQRRERIIDIAEKIFFKRGAERTTMETVAKTSAYTKQTLYLYFKNKEDLFSSVVLRGLNIMYASLRKAYEIAGTGLDKIRAIAQSYYLFYQENRNYFELILRFEINIYAYHKALTVNEHGFYVVECQKVNDAITDTLIEAVKSGIEDGSIKTSLDPKHLMLLIWAQTLGVMQVITMRHKYFDEFYELTPEQFFSYFMSSIGMALTHQNDTVL